MKRCLRSPFVFYKTSRREECYSLDLLGKQVQIDMTIFPLHIHFFMELRGFLARTKKTGPLYGRHVILISTSKTFISVDTFLFSNTPSYDLGLNDEGPYTLFYFSHRTFLLKIPFILYLGKERKGEKYPPVHPSLCTNIVGHI